MGSLQNVTWKVKDRLMVVVEEDDAAADDDFGSNKV